MPTQDVANPKRRDKPYIIAEILEIAKGGSKKTQIMYRGNLSFTQLNDYLEFMLGSNLLEKVDINGKDVYKSTDRGLHYLSLYGQLIELTRTDDENQTVQLPSKLLLIRRSNTYGKSK